MQKKKKSKIKPNQNVDIQEFIQQRFLMEFNKQPNFITLNAKFIFVGYEFVHVYESNTLVKVLGSEKKKKVIHMDTYQDYLLVSHENEIVLYQSFKEIFQYKFFKLKKALIVPIQATEEFLTEIKQEQYIELVIQDEQDHIYKFPIEIHFFQVKEVIRTQLFKYGDPSSKQKFKKKRIGKISDEEYVPPLSKQIQDMKIMDTKLQEHIQNMDDRESVNSNDQSPVKIKKKNSFLQKLFNKEQKEDSYIYSNQYFLLALSFPQKILVIRAFFGNKLNLEQSKIQVLLNFNRPDAYIYNLCFNLPSPQTEISQQLMLKSTCCWGLGNFKETNKRYVLLVINWGGREYYAFKVMSSESKIQIVQGGHFFIPIPFDHLASNILETRFITNSILYSFLPVEHGNELLFMTTSQFEYGVPFALSQIEKHTQQEKNIQHISQGQYNPKFYQYLRSTGETVIVSQGVMDSINDGFQQPNRLKLNIPLSQNMQFYSENDSIYILSQNKLYQVKIKHWDEHLHDLCEASEWEKLFQTAIQITQGQLTLLSNIPENDIQRYSTLKETCCQLALRYMLIELPNKNLRNRESVKYVIQFLVQTQNEEYLFKSIEDLLVGCGYKEIFYDYLRDFLQSQPANIPPEYLLRVLKMFFELDQQETAISIIMSLQNITFDTKHLVDFCIEKDLIDPLMYVCSQTNDFLTPYLRILTLMQVQMQGELERQITTLSVQQLIPYLFNYIQFCMTGYFKNQDNYFTEKQYKIMLIDLFEYLFDQQNLEQLFKIDYLWTLKVMLLAFQSKIQDIFKALESEGKQISIRMPKVVEEGLLTEVIDLNKTKPHLYPLCRIYALIKQAELTYYGSANDLEKLYSISAAFTSHVIAVCPIYFTSNHYILPIQHYMGLLRYQEDTIFDIQWVLKGRVQKDVPIELVKNEFLLRCIERCDYHDEIKIKSQECKWTWIECWCLQKCNRTVESFYKYMSNPEPLISERIFIILSQSLKQREEDYLDWTIKNLKLLAEENSQKLFQTIFTYCKDQIELFKKEMSRIGITDIDKKFDLKQIDLLQCFNEFLKPRL